MRLIDADALKEVIFSKTDGMDDLWDTAGVLNAINNAPTINDRSLEIAQKSVELGRKVGQLEGKISKAPTIENPCKSCEDKAIEYSLGFQDGFLTGRDSVKKTGTWSRKIFPEEKWTRERFYCSVCNGWNTYGKPKFCPNCGAEMKGGAE